MSVPATSLHRPLRHAGSLACVPHCQNVRWSLEFSVQSIAFPRLGTCEVWTPAGRTESSSTLSFVASVPVQDDEQEQPVSSVVPVLPLHEKREVAPPDLWTSIVVDGVT